MDQTWVLPHCRQSLYLLSHQGSPNGLGPWVLGWYDFHCFRFLVLVCGYFFINISHLYMCVLWLLLGFRIYVQVPGNYYTEVFAFRLSQSLLPLLVNIIQSADPSS